MDTLTAIRKAHEQTAEIKKRFEKIERYIDLLITCRTIINTKPRTVENNSRIATLKRAEARIENRIKVLGRSIVPEFVPNNYN